MTGFLAVSGAVFWAMLIGCTAAVSCVVTSMRWRQHHERRRGLRDIEQLLKREARR
jgi:hypothetical protein